MIELPQLANAPLVEALLLRWARRACSLEELDSLAVEDPVMAEAKKALERLSAEPSARALAEARERAEVYNALRDKQ